MPGSPRPMPEWYLYGLRIEFCRWIGEVQMIASKTRNVTKSTSHSGNIWAATGAISGIVGAAIALLGVSVANHWWIFKQPVKLTINAPSNGSIPRCATITGGMSLPTGYSVWVAQQGSGQPNYYNLTKATPVSGGWSATMTVGTAADRAKPFTIYAFAVNDQVSQLLSNIVTGPAKSFYYLSSSARSKHSRSRR